MDCNNLQNSYVLRILFVLCFWGEGDWLGAGEEGGLRNISSPLGGVSNIFRRFSGGAKFYGSILEYTPPPSPVHILYDRSLKHDNNTAVN
jgi:hypothetical protein